jgi:hypothetical protein
MIRPADHHVEGRFRPVNSKVRTTVSPERAAIVDDALTSGRHEWPFSCALVEPREAMIDCMAQAAFSDL